MTQTPTPTGSDILHRYGCSPLLLENRSLRQHIAANACGNVAIDTSVKTLLYCEYREIHTDFLAVINLISNA